VYQRGSLLDDLAMYLSCDTKKFHDNESSTHILHNLWTSTHRRGKLPPIPPWRRHWLRRCPVEGRRRVSGGAGRAEVQASRRRRTQTSSSEPDAGCRPATQPRGAVYTISRRNAAAEDGGRRAIAVVNSRACNPFRTTSAARAPPLGYMPPHRKSGRQSSAARPRHIRRR